jgi:DNA (cytosine-5)-methyltransferase 1
MVDGMLSHARPTFFEFFAGGGMARLGLGNRWQCLFANDICKEKAASYRAVFGDRELHVGDVAALDAAALPGAPSLAWASFPCQDLSLAGAGAGLAGSRSGTFKPFWKLICSLAAEDRAPKLVVLENVAGTLASHGGADFAFLLESFSAAGYCAGAFILDAVHFLPQSRPRLFIVGVHSSLRVPGKCVRSGPEDPWHPAQLRSAHAALPTRLRASWLWWNMPGPSAAPAVLENLLEPDGAVDWHSAAETAHIVSLMAPRHLQKLESARRTGRRMVGTIYRRTRQGAQRAEVRFDQVAGCLRTPGGGSSRQTVIIAERDRVRSRLLSPREAARLMGVPDSYPLPERRNSAYHLFGDGVAVPVAAWLSEWLLLPMLQAPASRPASTPAVETRYLAAMQDRSHKGSERGSRT